MSVRVNPDLEELRKRAFEPIAVIGMACRFPGNSNTPESLWQLLRDGVDVIEEVPRDRWDTDAFFSPDPEAPGKVCTRHGGFIKDVDLFDPEFFGITPKEANTMDPQQRLLMEVAWEALENAGQTLDDLSGSRGAVFIGMCSADYAHMMLSAGHDQLSGYMASGIAHSIAAGRLSYFLGLQGPCLTVDTACSSSLAAVHLAFQSLRRRECTLAVAGGVNLMLSPELSIVFSKMKMLAPDGRCKTFDASGDGFTRSEGCGVVVLKRYSDAVQNGDPILALVRGSALSQDGRSSGLTVPNGVAQQTVIRDALANSGIAPRNVGYIETHGTGTALGDPVEVRALGAVFADNHDDAHPLLLGAVKSNLGHLEGAAGIASFIKTVLTLQHREIPASIHLKTPNPHIPWPELPIAVPRERTRWVPNGSKRIAGISSFGFSGTNVHVVLEEASDPDSKAAEVEKPGERPAHLLPLSAKSDAALLELSRRVEAYLEGNDDSLADVCYTAGAGRSHFTHRLAILAESPEDARLKLSAAIRAEEMVGVHRGRFSLMARPKVAFLFAGQGSQYVDMGRRLYETHPGVRRIINESDEIVKRYLGESILPLMYSGGNASPRSEGREGGEDLDQPLFTQPALFSLGYALATTWISWGIEPAAALGHSFGEYVAACIAGVFSLEDGLKLSVARGRCMQSIKREGEMMAVFAPEAQVTAAIAPFAKTVSISAFNGPENTVVSGAAEDVRAIAAQLAAAGVRMQRLNVRTAFHSPLMDPILDAFEEAARTVTFKPSRIPIVSNVTGRMVPAGEILDAKYWRLHVKSPVRFADGLQTLNDKGCNAFLEIGPGAALLGMASKCLPADGKIWVPSLRPGRDDWHQILDSLGTLYVHGASVNWKTFDASYPRRKVLLPNYPFQRASYWFQERRRMAGWHEWLYEVQWQKANRASTPQEMLTGAQPKRWLILADRNGVGDRLAADLVGCGDEVRTLYADFMSGLTEEITRQCTQGCDGIVHLWSLDADNRSSMSIVTLEDAQTLTCESLMSIVQAVTRANPEKSPGVWSVTAGAQHVSADDALSPAQALSWGFGRTISLEHPEFWRGLVDLDPNASLDLKAALIASEILNSSEEDQIALRGTDRYVPRLVRIQAKTPNAPLFHAKPESAYLIVGGLGRLGLKLARWLAELGARHLVLTGRRGLNNASQETQAAIEEIKTMGATVDAVPVDAGDEQQMRLLFEQLRQGPPLSGVIHAAASYSAALLRDAQFDSFLPLLRAKVAGTWLLHELTREMNLDFFVIFSSTTSLLGVTQLAHYAASSQFQDTFAAYRRKIGQPALVINWGMWDQTGLGADREKSAQRFGLEPMDSTEALAALRHLLSTQALQMTVAAVDWPVLKPVYEAKRVRPFLEKILVPGRQAQALPGGGVPDWRSELEQARPLERWEKLAMNVEKEAAFVMGFPPSGRLDWNRGFFEMGMDSLISVELKKRLESRLGKTLPSALIFNYPTIHRLTGYLGKEILGLPAGEQAAAAAAASASALDLEIGRLTDAEVKASLLKELEGAGY